MSFTPTPRKPSAAPNQPGSSTPASNRFRSSLVPMHRPSPARNPKSASKVAASFSSTASRDLFRTTTPKASRTTPFAPNLPASAINPPPSIRKFAPKGTGVGMAGTASSELFKMRIPSPDPDLTGEVLAKAIPDSLNRKGTVYADQYLAHKCPPEFDDDQRRQFFCILDLRRLKFAANEIFAKKDWKLNIINFAKEYEKSRSLIMLRYGLYQFKNVKPSEEVMKKWRKAHGLPDPTPEPEKASITNTSKTPSGGSGNATSSKRKADDELKSSDNALKTSTFNQNKRRNVEQEATDDIPKFAPLPSKNKRKVDDAEEQDENQRTKQQKAAPSAARSKLEGIINNVQTGSSTPAGSPAKRPLFGTGTPTALFGTSKPTDTGKSVFDTDSNPYRPPSNGITDSSSKLQSNLFQPGQTLNGQSTGSVLAGHKFGLTPATKPTNIFGYLSESSANNSGNENANDETDGESESESEHESEQETESQDVAPSYEPSAAASTGTATPPIAGSSLFNFGKPPSSAPNPFASAFNKPIEQSAEQPSDKTDDTVPKGGLFGRVSFGPDGQPLRGQPAEEIAKPLSPVKPAVPVEAAQTDTPAKAAGDFTFNPATTPISFGTGSSNSLFAPKPTATQPATNGVEKSAEQPDQAPVTSSASIFGSQPVQSTTSTNSDQTAKPLFGNLSQPPKPSTPSTSLFGAVLPAQTAGVLGQTSTPLFGSVEKGPENEKATAPAMATSIFGAPKSAGTPSFSFGAATTQPAFGETSKSSRTDTPVVAEQPKNVFTSQPLFGTSNATNGTSSPTKEQPSNPFGAQSIFGASSSAGTTLAPAANSLFGTFKPASEPPKPDTNGNQFTFGNNATTSTNSLFGAPSPSPFPASNLASSAKRGFHDDENQPSKKTMFGRSDQSTDSGSQIASAPLFGGTTQTTSDLGVQPEKKSLFSGVTGSSTPTPGSPVPGRKILTPKRLRNAANTGQAGSTPASSFGGAATSFGSMDSKAEAPTNGNIFGNSNTSASQTFQFGSSAPVAEQREESGVNRSTFSFVSQNNTPSMFNAGSTHTPTTSFTFGGNGSQPAGDGVNTSTFNFNGGSAAAENSLFNFGGGNQDSSSNQGSFTFGGGGAGQSIPSTQSFGPGSATPTPSGSFNFQFGGQASSTQAPAEQSKPLFGAQPNGTSTAPTFNFSSATPQPDGGGKAAAPSMFGNLLQPGNTAPGASSPFPAPSSINTTPANGTPEPEEGDAAPAETQISLTQGGVGEEDEECLHEVRAKATKYVPVSKDDTPGKSPWQLQGLGLMRLLKNKSTGNVRVVLRAEPRGHIVMNKAILAGVNYEAIKKQVKVMTATDDGTGLETWLLQVKTEDAAKELARLFEANKTANK